MKNENNFTTGRILLPLLSFALPIFLALLLQAAYGAVDLMIVGKFGQTADVSAVATGVQVTDMLTTMITGFATGMTVLLGQKIGEQKPDEAGQAVGSGICLFLAISAVLTAVVVSCAPSLSALMHAPEEAFTQTTAYIRYCAAGTVFITAFNVFGSIFRGIGDSKIPLLAVGIACVVNILGDLLLVAVFHMGAAGAAIATVFAQAVSVVFSILIIRNRALPFRLQKKNLRFERVTTTATIRLGLPIAAQQLLVSISFAIITAIVNTMGLEKSAGVGVSQKICAFVMLIPSAFAQSMSAFVAQNIGARKPERAVKALKYGIGASLAVSVVVCLTTFFYGSVMSGFFSNDGVVIEYAADYLKSYAIDCLLTSFMFCFVGYFSGIGKSVFVMAQGIIGAFFVRIPVAFLLSRIPNVRLFVLGLSTPSSTLVQLLLCFWYFFRLKKKEPALLRQID